MSIELVNDAIDRFLTRADSEVLCIRGKWGVGKTFAWSRRLEVAQGKASVKLSRYSYVSLFGVNSLDELKLAIFENVILLNEGLKKADLQTLDAYVSKIGSWRKLTRIAQSIPIFRNVVGADATGLVSFMTIRDQIICIDDLERRGSKLEVGDVLGLISFLREQRNCKVVLILNDQQLEGGEKLKFESHLEKVVDASLVFRPSPSESVRYGVLKTDELHELVSERCVSLGITNIRVMKRIVRFVADIKPILAEFDPDVLTAAVGSIVLFCWSNDQPEEAPSIEFLKGKTQDTFGLRREELPPREAAWTALLEAYEYLWTDEFDLSLLEGIQDGYFNPDLVKKTARVLHDKVIATRADGSFEQAWRLYHDSFQNNQDEVLDTIYASFMRNFQYVTPTNLNGTVSLFKQLGRETQAHEMLQHYMDNRNEDRAFFDLDDDPFGGHIDDPDVREALRVRCAQVQETRDVRQMLMTLKEGWRDEQIEALAATPVDEYYRALKDNSGADLRKILSGVLQFDRIVNASEPMREISRRARAALRLIAAESPINARRVSRFGVVANDENRDLNNNQ